MSNPGSDQSIKSVYAADSRANMINFSAEEKSMVFKALFDAIPVFRSRIRIFSPRTSLYSLWKAYSKGTGGSYPCRGGIDFFFVDAKENNTYPCGYRGNEDLGKFWDLDMQKTVEAFCRKCDWECFRDPSELFGPLLHLLKTPWGYVKKAIHDKRAVKLWIEDLLYYRACEFYDGRKPPDYSRLGKCSP
jgi:hypothetical protein